MPWWVLKDVCDVLGIQNATEVAQRLGEDERARLNLGRQGEAWIINESGLYAVVLRSDKPDAKRFRHWVTSEVLPSIRKTGGYHVPEGPELSSQSFYYILIKRRFPASVTCGIRCTGLPSRKRSPNKKKKT
jgi:prophage antirepressor-like protein